MRLIIFVKVPEFVEAIPLDIIDDRASQAVIEDILLLIKREVKSQSNIHNYFLIGSGKQVDPDKTLTENGIKNGDTLELIRSREPVLAIPPVKELSEFPLIPEESALKETPIPEKKIQKKKAEQPPVIGKKIDFD